MTEDKKRSASTLRPPTIRRVLVVAKKTYLTEVTERNDERMLALIAAGHDSVVRVAPAHEEHLATLASVTDALTRRGIEFVSIFREQLEQEMCTHRYDLVVTVGGDGTVLDVSHFIKNGVPVLGVNSDTATSHGKYCLADKESFATILEVIAAGARQPLRIMRLQLVLNGKPLEELVLNEVLVANPEIGETSRYKITIDGRQEEQKSDGIFFGTAAGSTGWMRSYYAQVLPIKSRKLQYIVRGLIKVPGSRYRFVRGLLDSVETVKVESLMDRGQLFIDGRHIGYDFARGSDLIIERADSDLLLFIEPGVNSRYIAA